MLQNRSKYPRLIRRLHAFYMRVSIPTVLQPLALRKELVYSLGTRMNDRKTNATALAKEFGISRGLLYQVLKA